MRLFAASLALALVTFAAASAQSMQSGPAPAAQPSQSGPHRVRGVVQSFDGTLLTVKANDGTTVTVSVLPSTLIIYSEPRKLSDVKPGDFVASAAVTGSDGKIHSQEVRIFPEPLRGMGEGQYSMNDPTVPNRSMTNATVAQVAAVGKGGTLSLTYHGAGDPGASNCTGHAAEGGKGCVGQTQLYVAPGVPITAYVIGDTSSLVAGAAISMTVATGPDGNPISPRMLVEHNGVKPS